MSNWDLRFKNTLEEREVSPKKELWDQLDFMLDEEKKDEKPKGTNGKIWIKIAASVVIVIGILFYMLPKDETLIPKEKATISKLNMEKANTQEPSIQIQPIAEKDEVIQRENVLIKSKINIVQNNKTEIEKEIIPQVKIGEEPKLEIKDTLTYLVDLDNLHKQLRPAQNSAELLLNAINKKSLKSDSHIVVNSKVLLIEVEDELFEKNTPEFLDKITHKLKSLQLAVAERNINK